jgi:hypothetical protein
VKGNNSSNNELSYKPVAYLTQFGRGLSLLILGKNITKIANFGSKKTWCKFRFLRKLQDFKENFDWAIYKPLLYNNKVKNLYRRTSRWTTSLADQHICKVS